MNLSRIGWVAVSCLFLVDLPLASGWQEKSQDRQTRVMIGINFVGQSPVVWNVMPFSPAERAGILAGDEVVSLEGKVVLQPRDVARLLENHLPGDQVRLEILRNGHCVFIDVQVCKALGELERFAEDGTVVRREREYGMVGEKVPDITNCQWEGLPDGKTSLRREDLAGKIAVVMLFQVSSEFTRTEAIPILSRWYNRYGNDENVAFYAVQTSFPQDEQNTLESAAELLRQSGIPIPVGHDLAETLDHTACKLFRAPGSPWFVVVDREGIVRADGTVEDIHDDIIGQLQRGEPVQRARK